MLPFSWRAKSKPGKDAGSGDDCVGVRLESDPSYTFSDMGATEDAAWRRFAAARRREGIA
jgi:hypothetical protein